MGNFYTNFIAFGASQDSAVALMRDPAGNGRSNVAFTPPPAGIAEDDLMQV